jgi:hypothetical protein
MKGPVQSMNNIETKLNILIDGLHKKEQSLVEIVNITENQGTVLESSLPPGETQAFMAAMNREKQTHINTVLQCDTLFENMLKEIGPTLDAEQNNYKPQVKILQEGIRRVMDLDVKIRVCENRNSELSAKKQELPTAPPHTLKPPQQSIVTPDTGRVLKAYARNARN